MEAIYVNPILKACTTILKTLVFEDIQLGKLKLAKTHLFKGALSFVIWMSGDFNGRFIFALKKETALKISSVMIGKDVHELDEISKSAIAEMSSMILGRCGIYYSKQEISVTISAPLMVEGENIDILPLNGKENGKILIIPLIIKSGDVVEVRIEEELAG
ncbi:MAG: chemotaxis protein CheX [Clostridia bacterium]|nr:chemotaxis protein CheX [Clostridia bacterium]